MWRGCYTYLYRGRNKRGYPCFPHPFLPVMKEKDAKEDQGPTGAEEFSCGAPGKLGDVPNAYLRSLTKFNRSAFITTQKLERLMAAAPNMGVMPTPNTGIHTPAANGMPTTL